MDHSYHVGDLNFSCASEGVSNYCAGARLYAFRNYVGPRLARYTEVASWEEAFLCIMQDEGVASLVMSDAMEGSTNILYRELFTKEQLDMGVTMVKGGLTYVLTPPYLNPNSENMVHDLIIIRQMNLEDLRDDEEEEGAW